MIRRLLELLSRRVVLRRRLPDRFGAASIFVSPAARLTLWRWDLERVSPELFGWAEELVSPGDVVWDVGANVGLFSFAAANRAGAAGRVMAIEPDPWLAGLIARSIAGLPASFAFIDLKSLALSDQDGVEELVIGARGRAANYLGSVQGSSQSGGERCRVSVSTRRLDSLAVAEAPPSLVKIDVEGAEALVLRGARELLGRARPRLLVEVSEATSAMVGEELRRAHYRLYDAERSPGERRELAAPSWNTLALPEELAR